MSHGWAPGDRLPTWARHIKSSNGPRMCGSCDSGPRGGGDPGSTAQSGRARRGGRCRAEAWAVRGGVVWGGGWCRPGDSGGRHPAQGWMRGRASAPACDPISAPACDPALRVGWRADRRGGSAARDGVAGRVRDGMRDMGCGTGRAAEWGRGGVRDGVVLRGAKGAGPDVAGGAGGRPVGLGSGRVACAGRGVRMGGWRACRLPTCPACAVGPAGPVRLCALPGLCACERCVPYVACVCCGPCGSCERCVFCWPCGSACAADPVSPAGLRACGSYVPAGPRCL